MAFISKGISLSYAPVTAGVTGTFVKLDNLTSIPQLMGEPARVDCTTLDSSQRLYTSGLKDISNTLSFGFIFDNETENSCFRIACKLEKGEIATDGVNTYAWRVEFPDVPTSGTHGTQFEFMGKPAVSNAEQGIESVVTFNLNIAPETEISIVHPV